MLQLTDEQRAVVHHDPTRHATVLAVAGAGKTTTLAWRVHHLIHAHGAAPGRIRALMFNRDAALAFRNRLASIGVEGVEVRTFHSLAHRLIAWLVERRLVPDLPLLISDGDVAATLRNVLASARQARILSGDHDVDVDDLGSAIAQWKAMLVPATDARAPAQSELVTLYRHYEELRFGPRGWRTFDDLLFDVAHALIAHPDVRATLANRVDHFLLDEYQDVNLAQHRIVEMLAGERARVMAVGDDDQCIYEWRGARSAFIRRLFPTRFPAAEHDTYALTRTFRFGPHVARVAHAAVEGNASRLAKALVSAPSTPPTRVTIRRGVDDVDVVVEQLAHGVPPADLVVLVRTWEQSTPLQAALAARHIPFLVDGSSLFVRAESIRLLRHYLALADAIHRAVDEETTAHLLSIANRPVRYVAMAPLRDALRDATGARLSRTLRAVNELTEYGIHRRAARTLGELADLLEHAARSPRAADRAAVLRDGLDLGTWLADEGRDGDVDAWNQQLVHFIELLNLENVPATSVESWVNALDPRRGEPVERCVRITSIFRAKGLEWPHVILPNCVEGHFPVTRPEGALVDETPWTGDIAPAPALDRTSHDEAERRLFYVAATRARHSLTLVAPGEHAEPAASRFVAEAERAMGR